MTTKHAIFLGLVIANALIFVSKTGKPRKPISGGDAALGLCEWALLAWLALS